MSEPSPAPSPAPSPVPEPGPTPSSVPSRRLFLAGGAAVVLGAGAGVLTRILTDDDPPSGPTVPPAALLDAIAAERALLADLDATTGGERAVRKVIEQVRADHAAHLAALHKVLLSATQAPAPRSKPASGRPRTKSELQQAESSAAEAAAKHAAALTGPTAALLASIAACEATHAELLR